MTTYTPTALVAAFIVAHLQKAALARVERGSQIPFYLYLDEFQNYTTDNIKDILSESRKYALSLTLAHQYLEQLPGELRSAVLNTAGTIVSFRVGYQDGMKLAKEIFPSPDYLKHFKTGLTLRRTNHMPMPFITGKNQPLGWDGLALELANLKLRQFWSRKRNQYKPSRLVSFNMPDPEITAALQAKVQEMRDQSGQRYGLLKRKLKQKMDQTEDVYQESTDIPGWSA